MPVIKDDQRIGEYESVVRSYVLETGGTLLAVSDDRVLLELLRRVLRTQLSLSPNTLRVAANAVDLPRFVREHTRGGPAMLFVEDRLYPLNLGQSLARIKRDYSEVRTLVLTSDSDFSQITLFHEMGADNVIMKPIAAKTLVAKLAYTIQPHGELSKLISQGQKLLSRGDYPGAEALARTALQRKPGSAGALMLLGDALSGQDRTAEALLAYEQASESSRLYMEPLKKLAAHHADSGDRERQLDYLRRLDMLSPLNSSRKLEMGGLCLEMGHAQEADELFTASLEVVRKNALERQIAINERIGSMYLERGDPAKAETYFGQVLDLAGKDAALSHVDVFNKMGSALRKQGKWAEAVAIYQRALASRPQDENLVYNTSLAFADGGQHQQAYAEAAKVLALNPEFPTLSHVVACNLGQIALSAGKPEEARTHANQALALKPDYQRAKALLAQLA